MGTLFGQWIDEWAKDTLGLSAQMANYFGLLVLLVILVLLCLMVWYISRTFLILLIRRIVRRTENDWDDIILERKVFHNLAHIPPLIVIQLFTYYVLDDLAGWAPLVERLTEVLIVIVLAKVLLRFLNAVQDILMKQEELKDKPVHTFIQVAKVLVIVLFGIVALSLLLSRSPVYFLSAMGAASAVIIFIFKDSILALVASIQLMANDLLRVGDWVAVPKHNADGYVVKINLSTVMVQNWDNTLSSVPPYMFIGDSFINYRGMEEGDGRRIMQHLHLKLSSVSFCEEEGLKAYRDMELLEPFFEEWDRGRRTALTSSGEERSEALPPTNLELFRAYAEAFARRHPGINDGMLLLVRQLEAGEHGVPLQLYAFTHDKSLVGHSKVISEIFSHLIAMAPSFGLEVFESPSGSDLRKHFGKGTS